MVVSRAVASLLVSKKLFWSVGSQHVSLLVLTIAGRFLLQVPYVPHALHPIVVDFLPSSFRFSLFLVTCSLLSSFKFF